MEKALRIQKLKEIQETNEPYMTGIRIMYKGDPKPYSAYKIPLEYLIYNKYNGRIGSLVKSYETQNRELDAEKPEDSAIIEGFLYDSKPDRNKATMDSLVREGQKVFGIVQGDGVIIDGNRRAMLLNRIYREREEWVKKNQDVDKSRYFIAVILPADDYKEIIKLETTYQMGEDKKLDYNPIEKYLRCKDLKIKYKYDEGDIASMMAEDKPTISEWLDIMEMMDDYLDYLGYHGIYTRLEKREGQFVDLTGYIKRYKNPNKSTCVEWDYDELDVIDLKQICFDYIRAQYEGKAFRSIAAPGKYSFFCKAKVWNKFKEKHQALKEQIQELSVDEIRAGSPETNLTKLLEARDNDWRSNVEDLFKENFGQANYLLNDLNDRDRPFELAKRACDSLEAMDTEIDSFYSPQVNEILHKISQLVYEYRKLIKHKK